MSSIRLLFARPGFLTLERFHGRRVRYTSPIRLYLMFSVLYFAAVALVPNVGTVTYTPNAGETVDAAVVAERGAVLTAALNDAITRWVPRAMFVLVPLFAAFVMLVCARRGRHYPQHLYFAFHVHAIAFCAGALMAAAYIIEVPILSPLVALIALGLAVAHFVLALRRAYETTTLGAVWRAAIVGVLYVVVLFVTIVTLMFLTFDNIDFAT